MNNLVDELSRTITLKIQDELQKNYGKAIGSITRRIKKVVDSAIRNSHEYQSLIRGRGYPQIGDPDIQTDLLTILDRILKDIEVEGQIDIKVDLDRGTFKSNVSIKILNLDFSVLTAMPEASYVTNKGDYIPWLEWLLYEGDRSIIFNYHYIDGQFAASRTGKGIMGQKGTWSVPSDLAGTATDNFLTRAINDASIDIDKIVKEEFDRYF